jgi:hypothetical protein
MIKKIIIPSIFIILLIAVIMVLIPKSSNANIISESYISTVESSIDELNITKPLSNQDNDDNNDDNNDVDDPFNDDDNVDDPFNDDDDNVDDPFNDDDNDDNNNYSDLFGNKDNSNDYSSIPKPDVSVTGYVGLGLSSLFLGDNRFTDELGPDEPRNLYLASDAFSNINADYKFYSFRLFGNMDFTATIDTSGIPNFTIEPRELYVSFVSNNAVVNLGHLIIEWSQMDVYSTANYFNPYSSTIYSKQLLEGVNGVHGQFYFLGNMSFELVFLPLFTESSLSTSRLNIFLGGVGDLGETSLDDYLVDIDEGNLGGIFDDISNTGDEDENDYQAPPATGVSADTTPPRPDIFNSQIGFRYGLTFGGIDMYLMYFHGYYNQPLVTYTYHEPDIDDTGDPSDDTLTGSDDYGTLATGTVLMEIKRVYRMIDSIAFSTSFNLWEITFKGETAFTINAPVIFKRKVYIESTGVFLDRALTSAPTLHASIGLDWEFLDDFRLIAEYSEFFVLEDIDVDEETIPGNTLFGTVAYTLSLDTFDIILAQGVHFDYKDRQLVSISFIQLDFLNGFYTEIGLAYLNDFGAVVDGEENLEGIFGPANRSFILGILTYYEF